MVGAMGGVAGEGGTAEEEEGAWCLPLPQYITYWTFCLIIPCSFGILRLH